MIEKIEPFIQSISKETNHALKVRAGASYVVLKKIDIILDAFVKSKTDEPGQILIQIYGLLQSLFVSIDAMYDLAIGLTHYKYHVNINKNKSLHELKYIRNDVVGHPTHRTYEHQATGFSVIDYDSITMESLSYKTVIFQNRNVTNQERTVLFSELIENFRKEKSRFLKDLYVFLTKTTKESQLGKLTVSFFEHSNLETLEKIEKAFINENPNISQNHRFLWRVDLLKILLGWHESDAFYQALIDYIIKIQAQKLNQIQNDLNETDISLPYVSIPTLLGKVYRYFKKHPTLVSYIQNLHDLDHPNFDSDLMYLIHEVKSSPDMSAFFNWFKNLESEAKTYLVGSTIKAFRT